MANNAFQDVTEDDFAPPKEARPAGTNPATGNQFTAPEMFREVVGKPSAAAEIEPNPLKRGLAGAGWSFENLAAGLLGKPGVESYGLKDDAVGVFGAAVPQIAGSMLAGERVLPQALYGAAVRGMEPAPNMLERGINAAKGAAEYGIGQGIASGIVKGSNAAAGNLTRRGQIANAAELQGLDLSAGDILDSKLLRLMEDKSIASPTAKQGEQIAGQMADPVNNPIYNAVTTAYERAQTKVSDAANRLDTIIQQGGLPNVVPRNFSDAVKQISQRSPSTLNRIDDPVIRGKLEAIAATPNGRIPKGMTFSELDEMRKVLGPIMSKIEMQAKSGASNINNADSNRWKQLYKGIMTDIDQWGSKKATEDALAAHKELSSTFKEEVLPLREHPVAGKILSGGYDRPEDMLRDITSARNKSVTNQLYDRLDQGGKNAFDALRATQRGSREFVRGEPTSAWAKPFALTAGLTAPAWAPGVGAALPWVGGGLAAEQALVHGLNTKLGRKMLGGLPEAAANPLANRAIYAGLRSAPTQSALQVLRSQEQ